MSFTGLHRGQDQDLPNSDVRRPRVERRAAGTPLGGALAQGLLLLARPGLFRGWMIFVYAVLLSAGLALFAAAGPMRLGLTRAALLWRADASGALLGRIRPLIPMLWLAATGVYAVLATAVERAVLRPEARSLAYLRLGRAEAVRAVCVLMSLMAMAGAALLALLAGAVVEAVAAVLVYALTGDASAEPIFTSSAVLLPMMAIGAIAGVGARLSLCPSIAFVTGRIDPHLSWRLTQGRTGALVRVRLIGLLAGAAVLGAALLVGLAPAPPLAPVPEGALWGLRLAMDVLLWPAAALATLVGGTALGPALWLRLGSAEA